jgi:hypothetical protein
VIPLAEMTSHPHQGVQLLGVLDALGRDLCGVGTEREADVSGPL